MKIQKQPKAIRHPSGSLCKRLKANMPDKKKNICCGPPGPRGCPGKRGVDAAFIGNATNGNPVTLVSNAPPSFIVSTSVLGKNTLGWFITASIQIQVNPDVSIVNPALGTFNMFLFRGTTQIQSYNQTIQILPSGSTFYTISFSWFDAGVPPGFITYSLQAGFSYTTSPAISLVVFPSTLAVSPIVLYS